MSIAYVICCNDSVEHVVLDNVEIANQELVARQKRGYEQQKAHWQSQYQSLGRHYVNAFDYYKSICYWHIHTVRYTQ